MPCGHLVLRAVHVALLLHELQAKPTTGFANVNVEIVGPQNAERLALSGSP